MKDFEWFKEALLEWKEHNNYLPEFSPQDYPYIGVSTVSMQFYGCELVLTKDGKWFMNDTRD